MTGLESSQSSYIILSAGRINEMTTVLYSKEYQILPIQGYFNGVFEDSVIAYGQDNETLRRDVIFLLDHFQQESAIIKYQGETNTKTVFFDGSEYPMDLLMYNTDSTKKTYIHNGISFAFKEAKRYWIPKTMEDLKVGMIVEYMNNNKWYEKKVQNPSEEWEKLYKLLIKYDKLRVSA
jgi:hypothetical protein